MLGELMARRGAGGSRGGVGRGVQPPGPVLQRCRAGGGHSVCSRVSASFGVQMGRGGEAERGCEGAWSPRALFPSTDPMENGDTEARVGCSGEGGLLCSLG